MFVKQPHVMFEKKKKISLEVASHSTLYRQQLRFFLLSHHRAKKLWEKGALFSFTFSALTVFFYVLYSVTEVLRICHRSP